ncbi:PAS domain-containing hybrid sensor histidine kinase/response regulator [Sneathiella limimaris]|uniref:PAS domain-containing hybrid sensor histidine kinase/response regulator n=1 Tax=Sneathiella limimaris TaxID=1964213 RepID=UPI00146F81B1|nr:PAS domain-containing hybrid sensor histidine kinase/response regulator [Sneathiella limimaris]
MSKKLKSAQTEHSLEAELQQHVQSKPEIFDFIQNTVLDGIWYFDLENPGYEWMNDQFWSLLGYDPKSDAVDTLEWKDLIFPEDAKLAEENLKNQNPEPSQLYDQILRFYHKDGSTIWFRCRGMQIPTDSGNALRMLIALTDITELKKTEEALRESKQVLETQLTEQLRELEFQKYALDEHAIVSIADVKGNITYVNDKFCEISGYTRDELIGKNHRILKSGEHDEEFYRTLWRTIANGGTWNGKIKNLKKDGNIYWVWATIIPVLDEQGKPTRYVSIRTDLTDQIVAEERAKIAKAEAEAANQAKSDFLANMSHELRTPLNAVIGFAEFVELGVTAQNMNAEKICNYARSIGGAGRDLLRLINDLLDFAKIEANQFELSEAPFLLTEEIGNIASTFAGKAEENNVRLQTVEDNLQYTVFGDAMRMRQVIFNLLDNALKFSQGGTVTIRSTARSIDESTLALEVEVKDDGIGIEAERMEAIFNPFAQSDSSIARDFGGTGLGLPISRHLARLMGGDVTAVSTAGLGSTFTATFVLKDLTKLHHSLSLLNATPSQNAAMHLGLSVLAVDDVETNLDVLETMLTDFDCEVYKVRNGKEAVEWAKEHTVDVILMDLHMPVMDGISAAREIKQLASPTKDTPIYAWTADITSKSLLQKSDIQWAGTILKPTTRNSLLLALKNTLQQQRHN